MFGALFAMLTGRAVARLEPPQMRLERLAQRQLQEQQAQLQEQAIRRAQEGQRQQAQQLQGRTPTSPGMSSGNGLTPPFSST